MWREQIRTLDIFHSTSVALNNPRGSVTIISTQSSYISVGVPVDDARQIDDLFAAGD